MRTRLSLFIKPVGLFIITEVSLGFPSKRFGLFLLGFPWFVYYEGDTKNTHETLLYYGVAHGNMNNANNCSITHGNTISFFIINEHQAQERKSHE